MERFKTRLNRGLYELDDTIDAPMDTLRRAQGARYLRDTGYLTPALGRRHIGAYYPDPGHGSHVLTPPVSFDGIRGVCGLQWMGGSTVDGGTPELKQIAYVDRGMLKTIPAKADAADSAMDATGARTVGAIGGGSQDHRDLIPIALGSSGEYVLLTGSIPMLMRRTSTGQEVREFGLYIDSPKPETIAEPLIGDSIIMLEDPAIAGSRTIDAGVYCFWLTMIDPDTGYESPAFLANTAHFVRTAASVIAVNMYLRLGAFTSYLTAHPTYKLRLWLGAAEYDGTSTVQTDATYTVATVAGFKRRQLTNTFGKLAWPVAGLVKELTGAELAALTINILRPGETSTSIYYDLGRLNDWAYKIPDLTPIYDFIEIVEDGEAADAAENQNAPSASHGDMFGDSLCLIDINNKRKGRYSIPGKYHAFPEPYHINFDDDLIAVASVDKKAGWLCRTSVWAVNWLPYQSDVDFSRGRVKELISPSRGLVNPFALAKVSWPGYGAAVAWVSDDGIYISDWMRPPERITDTMSWPPAGAQPENMMLVDDPDQNRLVLTVQVPGRADQYYLYYDKAHREGILPAILGPVPFRSITRCVQIIDSSGARRILTTDRIGSIFYNDIGHQDRSELEEDDHENQTIVLVGESQEHFPAGIGSEVEVTAIFMVAREIGNITEAALFNPSKKLAAQSDFSIRGLEEPNEPFAMRTLLRRVESVKWSFAIQGTARLSELGLLYNSTDKARR